MYDPTVITSEYVSSLSALLLGLALLFLALRIAIRAQAQRMSTVRAMLNDSFAIDGTVAAQVGPEADDDPFSVLDSDFRTTNGRNRIITHAFCALIIASSILLMLTSTSRMIDNGGIVTKGIDHDKAVESIEEKYKIGRASCRERV